MLRRHPIRSCILGAWAASFSLAGAAAPSAPPGLDPAAQLPLDSRVLRGRLDNGLLYLIRENGRPEARAMLRLVVKAGSVDEDEDQRGLAHFVEHMLFNGTESYEGNEIVAYLESIGARFGADLNAYTTFDETVYRMEIPTDREGLLPEGIRILGEFAARATLAPEEIEKERGVILDEWRRRLGAGKRVRDEQLPVILKGSRYAERLPIGLPEVIEGAPPDVIRRFYHDWYRPERMAVIAVGDFDASAVEGWIRETFGAIRPEGSPRERVDWEVPLHADTLFALADDPELRGTSVGISTKRPPREDVATYGAYRADLVRSVALRMFNERLAELSRSGDPPFLGAGLGTHRVGRTVEMTNLGARVREGEEARGLRALVVEAQRALRHGFTDTELDRVRREMLAGIEASYAEREKTASGGYVAEYTRHFLHDEPIPGIELEVELWRSFLPGIGAGECLAALRELLGGGGVVVEATRPTREGLAGPDELLAALRRAAAHEPEAYVDEAAGAVLIADPAPPGRVEEVREIPEIGVTEAVLSNGVHVFLKPTDFQDDEVRFSGWALGGISVAPDESLASASHAAGIVGESGWGGHSPVELGKILAGKMVSASPFFSGRHHGVSGSSTVADLPVALELAVLVMTEPNHDPIAFERFLDRLRADLANREADPAARYADRVVAVNTLDHPRLRPMTLDRIEEIDLDDALRFYEDSFANAADFSFFLVGNLDLEAVLPVLERTLGSLPSDGEPSSRWVDREIPFPASPVVEVVRAGHEPKGRTTFTLLSYDGQDPREWHRIRTACSILQRRLRESLREELGATYGVSVRYDFSMIGPARGKIRVRYGSAPERAEELLGRVRATVADLVREGPRSGEVAKEKEIQRRELETRLRRNGFWLGSLAGLRIRQRPLREVQDRMTRIEELTAEELHRVFREHFSSGRHTAVIWKPQEEQEPEGTR